MSEGLIEAAKQIPALFLVVVLVVYFLRYLQAINKSQEARMSLIIADYRKDREIMQNTLERVVVAVANLERTSMDIRTHDSNR